MTCLANSPFSCFSSKAFPKFECPSSVVDLSSPSPLETVSNCTTIAGNLVITGLSNTQCRPGGLSLPRLQEVLGSLTVEHSSCSGDLSNFFPHLFAIHGIPLFTPPLIIAGKVSIPPFSLLIHHTALSGIGLYCLRILGENGVLLLDNPQMCYADTVGWHLLTPSSTSNSHLSNATNFKRSGVGIGNDLLRMVGLYDLCANACPLGCSWAAVGDRQGSFCWSLHQCQRVCAPRCRENSLSCTVNDTNQCCHPNCLGGCTGPTVSECLACRHFRHDTDCVSTCPKGYYELFGRYCVTREACLSKTVPNDLLILHEDIQQPGLQPINFSIQGTVCTAFCDKGSRRSISGECLPCGTDCNDLNLECGDIVIYQQADLALAKHCVSARSVFISIRTGKDDLLTALADAFSSLRVIYRSLRIIRSDALLSLSFLQNLTTIHGTEGVSKDGKIVSSLSSSVVTALEITWNGNLEDLWSLPAGTPKLEILSGNVEFSVNNRLCPCKILTFLGDRVTLTRGRDLTSSELDLIKSSNGEYALCNAKPLNVSIVMVTQNSVSLRMNRIVLNDPRQVLPAMISYGKRDSLNSRFDIQDRTFCDSAWNEVELNCYLPPTSGKLAGEEMLICQLDNLMPATAYSAFVTIATLSKHEGALSQRFSFTTKPSTPSSPTSLRALPEGPTSIKLHWNPPNRPNGNIVYYRIRYTKMNLEETDFLFRDACYAIPFQQHAYGDSSSKTSQVPVNTFSDQQDVCLEVESHGDDESCGDAQSSSSSSSSTSPLSSTRAPKRSELIMEELQRREMIRFEDELHKIILVPRVLSLLEFDLDADVEEEEIRRYYDYVHHEEEGEELSYGYALNLFRRRRDADERNGTTSSFTTIRVPLVLDDHGEMSASSPTKGSYLVTGLEHFTEYLFFISACHEPHDESGNRLSCIGEDCDSESNAGCNQPVRISQRTQAIPHADEVPSASLDARTHVSSTTTPHPPINVSRVPSTSQPGDSASLVQLFWSKPDNPNGLILYYWLQYRQIGGVNSQLRESTSPWFTMCVPTQDLEDEQQNGVYDGALRSPRSTTSSSTRRVFTKLEFLRTGFYEWRVMAVSLAGNGSWTESHYFNVVHGEGSSLLQPSHITAILLVTLLAVSLVVGLAIWFDHRGKKRRLNALANQKSEYLESLLLENLQDEWEVEPKDLTYNIEDTLGQGSFGLVCRGRLTRITTPAAQYLPNLVSTSTESGAEVSQRPPVLSEGTSLFHRSRRRLISALRLSRKPKDEQIWVDVAVKILSPGSTYEDVREFLSEASHMKQFNCNHIVRLLGVVSKQVLIRRQPIVVMELMQHGDLATYLRLRMGQEDYSQGSIAPELAIKWAAEVADGMAYLEKKGFVHRDLAARNCLVGVGLTVKIGDFGLTRDISGHLYYRKQGRARLPVRWMAPEALKEAYFTFKSDVWSYGVVLWEIATFAALPFSGLSHEEVISLVVNGGHLGKQGWPTKFPDILIDVMQMCWHNNHTGRPSFGDIICMLESYVGDNFRTKSFFLNQSHTESNCGPDERRGSVVDDSKEGLGASDIPI